MHGCDQGKNHEAEVDDGSIMSLQRVEMHGHILKFDDGEGPFYDDLTRQQLPTQLVKAARRKELDYFAYSDEFLCQSPIEVTAARR